MLHWAEAEEYAQRKLAPAFDEYIDLWVDVSVVYDDIARALTDLGGGAPADSDVMAILLANQIATLRAVVTTARIGYPLQALGLAANAYENAHIVTYLSGSPDRVAQWRSHTDMWKWPPRKVKWGDIFRDAVTKTVSLYSGETEAEVERRRRVYRDLCAAKHGNPQLLRRIGVIREEEKVRVVVAPHATEEAIRGGRFALVQAFDATLMAAVFFIGQYLEDPARQELTPRLSAALKRLYDLRKRDIAQPESGGGE